MKRILTFALIALITCAQTAYCHPPKNIDLKLDGQKLTIAIFHPVLIPSNHYIKNIKVLVNNWKAIDQDFTSQTDNDFQRATFTIPAISKGVKIEVIAVCNKGGEKKAEIVATQ